MMHRFKYRTGYCESADYSLDRKLVDAIDTDNVNFVKLLVKELGVNPNKNAATSYTPLFLASLRSFKMTRTMLKLGADPLQSDSSKRTCQDYPLGNPAAKTYLKVVATTLQMRRKIGLAHNI